MSEKTSQITYSEERRPNKSVTSGSGNYCCIPGCKSTQYKIENKEKSKTGIGFFRFPKSPSKKKNWVAVVSKYRRKGGADVFNKKTALVCEFHFKHDEIKVSLGKGIKKLKRPGTVPSVFEVRKTEPSKKRKPPAQRNICFENTDSFQIPSSSTQVEENASFSIDSDEQNQNNLCVKCIELEKVIEELRLELEQNEIIKNESNILKTDNKTLKNNLSILISTRIYSYENISNNDKLFKSATGLQPDDFSALYTFLNPGKECENIKYYETVEKSKSTYESSCKPGPKPKLDGKNQMFLFLTWLKNGFTTTHVSWLFDRPKSSISRYLITWTNFLYFKLGSVPMWPTKEQVLQTMPVTFMETYPSTRCIIDCTELFCQKPSSLATQSSLYSQYKHHVTYKGLIGIAPSGAITFISELYDGSISDKEIVKRSGILNKDLWDKNDSIMADRGFLIEKELEPLGVKLNIPAFLSGREQLSEEEVIESQTIASVRIHVERAIARIKKFRQIRNEIPLTLHGSVNQLWTVTCILCNFLPPLIKKGKAKDIS